MKAVVTGGMGFIGSHLCEILLDNDFQVTVIDNESTGRKENVEHLSDKITCVSADIADQNVKLEDYFTGNDYVFHLAALADIVPSIQRPTDYYRANVDGTLRVMEACRKVKGLKKVVYAASSSCYGIPDNFPTKETDEIRPQYPYALTKYLGEEILMHWGKLYKIPVVSLRLFNVYGPRSRTSGTYGAVFGVFLAQKLAGKPFTVVGDGTQTRDFTYVSDVANAFYTAAISNVHQEIMNVGSGNHYSINNLVELLEGEKVYIPKRPGEPDCTFADTQKIARLLKWNPIIKFEDGVSKMIEHIDYWKNAVVWDPRSISNATKEWFEALS